MFLARMIKLYGEKQVLTAIGKLSLKSCPPVEITSYFIGILKQEQTVTKKQKSILSI
jgi:hypothetical protein